MRYITFFQFLRRCLLKDAEVSVPPVEISKQIERLSKKDGTGNSDQTD